MHISEGTILTTETITCPSTIRIGTGDGAVRTDEASVSGRGFPLHASNGTGSRRQSKESPSLMDQLGSTVTTGNNTVLTTTPATTRTTTTGIGKHCTICY